MPARRTKRFLRNLRRTWLPKEIRTLRESARAKISAARIAAKLQRTEGAIRQKAFGIGLSLETRNVA
jgi:hypothetical protein